MADFKFEIKEKFGVLSEKNGYSKEFNFVSYNDREPVYDIRTWYTDDEGTLKMQKGVTLSKEEIEKLLPLLKKALGE